MARGRGTGVLVGASDEAGETVLVMVAFFPGKRVELQMVLLCTPGRKISANVITWICGGCGTRGLTSFGVNPLVETVSCVSGAGTMRLGWVGKMAEG